MGNITFDKVARSERYFTASLLPHLLMSHNFKFLKIFFIKVYGIKPKNFNDEFEVVSELDPVRDSSVVNKTIKSIYKSDGRIAVPDLFLRWDKWIISIEAKFFTDPLDEDLDEQLDLQIKAIEKVRKETAYDKNYQIKFCLINNNPKTKLKEKEIVTLTWNDIIDLFIGQGKIKDPDILYTIGILKFAVSRANQAFSTSKKKIHFQRISSLKSLIHELPVLISKGKVFVGFSGGIDALESSSFEDLDKRSHYKVSDIKWTEQWLPIHLIIKRYLELTNMDYS
jgi:hypothetical protein